MFLRSSFLALFMGLATYAAAAPTTFHNDSLTIGFVSSNVRFTKGKQPPIKPVKQLQMTAWKGEKLSVQLVVQSNEDINQLKASVGTFKTAGASLPSDALKIGYVKYVMTDEFSEGCGHRKPEDFDSSQVTDPILVQPATQVAKGTHQPIWLSISIPENAKAGTYQGIVTVSAGKEHKFNLSLKVLDRVLPSPDKWSYDLDLWQHPAAIARVHHVPLWSDEHFEAMRPYYTMLAKAGQKNITTSIMEEPWGHQTYDDFPSLIKWIKQSDGKWRYDYTLFDRYVNFVTECGIKERINCYTMIPWKLSFAYYDEKTQKDTALVAKPGSAEYNQFWSTMLTDFASHLKAKGWFDKTSISMDERPMKDMQAVIQLLKTVDPNWKIAMAGDYHPEIEKDIYDYSIASKSVFPDSVLARRKAAGMPSTYYTCCVEAYPNGFTFSPPAENVWLGWYASSKGFTGYLRWAYNSWPKSPLTDSRFTAWPAGDTYQVYPNASTSIRFEKMIEGIQDFEKIKVLKTQWEKEKSTAKLKELESVLSTFKIESLKDTPAEDMMAAGKALLNK